ncbi:MAG: energy transducer TonB, partial [Deltaproteobacteria bacterium]|nr:energy transducer TonB [Deltaproteobacteria bacterium]
GTPAADGKTAALPGRKPRAANRAAPVAAASSREAPENVAPAEKEIKDLLADIPPSTEWTGPQDDAGALQEMASPAPAVFIPGGEDPSGSIGSDIPASRQGGGEFSRGNDTGGLAARGEGTGTPQEGSAEWSSRDTDAVPRYGDNALPAYPPLARLRGYQGVAVLLVEVRADGRVGQVGIKRSTGHEILDRTALEAVLSWKFEPGRREGRPMTMSVAVPVRFVLKENSILVKTDDYR